MLRNLSIRTGLSLVLVFFTSALLLAISSGWLSSRLAGQSFESLYRDISTTLLPLKQAEARIWGSQVALATAHRNTLRGENIENVRAETGHAEKSLVEADKLLQEVVDTTKLSPPEEAEFAVKTLSAFQAYAVLARKGGAGLARGNGTDYSDTEMVEKRGQHLREMDGHMRKLSESIEKRNGAMYASAQSTLKLAQVGAVVLILLGLLLAAGCWSFFKTKVLRPLAEAGRLLEQVAQGDLTQQVQAHSTNEIGRLMGSLQTMQEGLVQTVSQVCWGVDQITAGTHEIAGGNNDLSYRTEQQAASLQETAASMEELASTVKQNAENASMADNLATECMTVAQHGEVAAGKVVETMRGISASSSKISEIVSVIDGIAFQTNILALNAAIEAARAGEQGRGFAVVAGEVRKLAQRSAEAAKEIGALIEESADKVVSGSKQVELASSTMHEIVTSVRRVTSIMSEIAAASREQSTGIDQVNLAVVQMDQTTQQNAALVEETSAAAASLEEQAQRLQSVVSRFQVPVDAGEQYGVSHEVGLRLAARDQRLLPTAAA